MKRLLALGVVAVAFAAGCAGKQLPKETITASGQLAFNGYSESKVSCYRCHNGDARGTLRGPNLSKRVPGKSEEDLELTIHNGKDDMPAFKGKLTDKEMDDIVEWLHAQFGAGAKKS